MNTCLSLVGGRSDLFNSRGNWSKGGKGYFQTSGGSWLKGGVNKFRGVWNLDEAMITQLILCRTVSGIF